MAATGRQRLSRLLQFHGYVACHEALVLLDDHFTSSLNKYDSIEDFIEKLNLVITFKIKNGSSVINADLAHTAIEKLNANASLLADEPNQADGDENNDVSGPLSSSPQVAEVVAPDSLPIKVKNIELEQQAAGSSSGAATNNFEHQQNTITIGHNSSKQADEFNVHYNFLFKRLNSLPIFRENFQLTKLSTLTGSTQPSIRCICFGLLIKDISKIDGYRLRDSTGFVPVRLTADTVFRNRLAYLNCIVLIEGVYVNPDDVLFAANIGLPPILLDSPTLATSSLNKALACKDEKLVIILRDLYMDDEDVCKAVDFLFTGYNSMDEPPLLFILIGDFTRELYRTSDYRAHSKKLIRIIRACDNLKQCGFVFVPGPKDTSFIFNGELKENHSMPKGALTKEQLPIDLLRLSNFENVHLATNPTHIYIGERQISVVSYSYFKELKKNLLHDLSDHNEEFYETAMKIILSNGHFSAGISKEFSSSMKLWHKPDLLILADTESIGNKHDFNRPHLSDTTFATAPSFSRSYNSFKVYYVKTGEIEDSQVSSEAMQQLAEILEAENGDDASEADATTSEPPQVVSELD